MQLEPKIAVVGGGIAGMMAALRLARSGCNVTLFEAADRLGGKIRTETFDLNGSSVSLDCGPTVFSLKPLFDEMFETMGLCFDALVETTPDPLLARHFWSGDKGEIVSLDLYADIEQSMDAVGTFSGSRDARAFGALLEHARYVFRAVDKPFMRAVSPSAPALIASLPQLGLPLLFKAQPWLSVWSYLKAHFSDPRLVQLFARYSTYCGGNPMRTSALLLLVLEAEFAGIWSLNGGMSALAKALAQQLRQAGVTVETGAAVARIDVAAGAIRGVQLDEGDGYAFDGVVVAGDVSALQSMLDAGPRVKVPKPVRATHRSNSAATLTSACVLSGQISGLTTARHAVFFSADYEQEFEAIEDGRIPDDPTLYMNCTALNIDGPDVLDGEAVSGIFCIANARALQTHEEQRVPLPNAGHQTGNDGADLLSEERELWQSRIELKFRSMGLDLTHKSAPKVTLPQDFAARYPGSGGALFGRAPHGMLASFLRPGLRSRIRGLYLASGSAHPSAGVPMAALSGFTAAGAALADLVSTRRLHPAATFGGTSTL